MDKYLNEPWVAVGEGDEAHIAPSSAFVDGKRFYQDTVVYGISRELADHLVELHNARLFGPAEQPSPAGSFERLKDLTRATLAYSESGDAYWTSLTAARDAAAHFIESNGGWFPLPLPEFKKIANGMAEYEVHGL